ncbi:hypothetical protein I5677_00555 [Mobilitalea sibirica]|uniref:Uncharacterized protein n=1 Tax=Mobilitalea sibirica TaxID=1462919 RepID=A0A8J7H085_9FIRM|nr:hypothetical protein [Mobilitalea sibirica]MBH1939377.1 hypothetical protein [Mobilitalea sibirica]
MKKYIKPTLEMIELRSEERLASCRLRWVRPFWLFWWWGCFAKYKNGGGCS